MYPNNVKDSIEIEYIKSRISHCFILLIGRSLKLCPNSPGESAVIIFLLYFYAKVVSTDQYFVSLLKMQHFSFLYIYTSEAKTFTRAHVKNASVYTPQILKIIFR